jgi:hypothetical protein
MADKAKSGKTALLFAPTKGALIVGAPPAPLAIDSWYQINSKAAVPVIPDFPLTSFFKTGGAPAIVPAIGDDVFPVTLDITKRIAKVDITNSQDKGSVDVTDDDVLDGYNSAITDGFTGISGTGKAWLKFGDPLGDLTAAQLVFLSKFYSVMTDDGAGVYIYTAKDDLDMILAILLNADESAVADIQVWQLIPIILTGLTTDKPLKGAQNFDFTWTKAQGIAQVYRRTTNATETVF